MPFDSLPVLDDVDLTLRKAREIIQQGWCQGGIHRNKHQQHCAVGAIRMAVGWKTNALYRKTLERLADSLPKQYFQFKSDICGVMSWNDAKCRTVDQVLAQFDKCYPKIVVFPE